MNRLCFALVMLLTAGAQAQTVKKLDADLDGDGVKEQIELSVAKNGAYVLRAGKLAAKCRFSDFEDPSKLSVETVDFDKADNTLQLRVIFQSGTDSLMINRDDYYVATGRKLKRVLSVKTQTQSLRIAGNGIVYLTHPKSFYKEVSKRVFDKQAMAFNEIEQPFAYVGMKVQTQKSFPIFYLAREKAALVAWVKSASEIEVLLAKNDWYLVKTSSRLVGWARGKNIEALFASERKTLHYSP